MAWDTMLGFLLGLGDKAPHVVEGVMRPHMVGGRVVLERKS